jgi:uncharacterized LabA/DUF88 family protein
VSIAPRRPASGRTGGAFHIVTRVAVFIDWQNTYKTAREAFGWRDWPNEYGNYSPLELAQILARGNERNDLAELIRVFVYRGMPSNRIDPAGYAANRRQSAAWMRENEDIVVPKVRQLRYLGEDGLTAREKGIDVLLAIDAVEWTLTDRCEVAVVFSHDTDLAPAVEALARLKGVGCVETASWRSDTFHSRIRVQPQPFHHYVDAGLFERVERRVNYAHAQ